MEPLVPESAPRPQEATVEWSLALATVGDVGDVPAPRLGVGLSLSVGPRQSALRVAASGAVFAPSSTEVGSAGGGRFTLATGNLSACVQPSGPRWEWGACADLAGAWLYASGSGQAERRAGLAGWFLLGAHVLGAFRVTPRWDVRLEVGPTLAVLRPSFVSADPLAGDTVVFRPSMVSGRAALAVEARF